MTLVICLFSALFVRAQQTTGDIVGTVTDVSGAPIPRAMVSIANLGTHIQRTAVTNETGEYVVNLLQPGEYSLKVESNGFKTFTVPSLTLQGGDRARFNAQLAVGATSETITVEADATALQTDSSIISSTIGEKSVDDLPLNGRNLVQMVQVQPGVNEGPPDSLNNGGKYDDQRQTAAFSANGQSDAMNNQTIDGLDNNERWVGTIGVRTSLDAISEMNVTTSNYAAEFGRTGGGVVNVITKSGTNSLHGDVYEFFRNDALDTYAYSFGQKLPKSELRQNNFGGSVGGPLRKNKAFLFGDYEAFRQIKQSPPNVSVVPTLYQQQHPGDFSDVGGPVIPAASLDPAAVAYWSLYPAPNDGPNNYVGTAKRSQFSTTVDARFDQQFNTANQFFARFNLNKLHTDSPSSLPVAALGSTGIKLDPGFGIQSPQFMYSTAFGYVHTFNPNLLLQIKGQYLRLDTLTSGTTEGTNANQALGQPGVNTPLGGCTGLAFVVVIGGGSGLGSGCVFAPDHNNDNVYQLLSDVTYTHGTHNLKAGIGGAKRQLKQQQSPFGQGLWLFLGPENFLQGNVLQVQRSLDLFIPFYQSYEPSIYAQDDWRIAKNLTLNLGLRWDWYQPLVETSSRISNFNPYTAVMEVANRNGVSQYAGIAPRYHDFEPRVGFAYTVRQGLVIRGAYGISYAPLNSTSTGSLKNPPFISAATYYGGKFINGLPAPKPNSVALDDPGAAIPYAEDPRWQDTQFQQFNLTVQKDFSGNVVTLTYLGILSRHNLQYFTDLNAPPPNQNSLGSPASNALRPYYSKYPNLSTIGYSMSGGVSSYNGFNASFERRLKQGLTVNVNYNFAHNLDNLTGLSEQQNQGGLGAVPSLSSKLDYGNSILDIRHRIAATANYELPFGKNATSMLGRTFLKGWQANLIQVWQTGTPFTIINGSSVSNTVSGGNDRPNYLPQKGTTTPSGYFFNPADFQVQQAGTIGVLQQCSTPGCYTSPVFGPYQERRQQFHGPHYRHLDVSLFKNFPIADKANVEFRVESFNLTNTSNFATPDATITDQNFGKITSLLGSYTPRELQLALKLSF
jgi:hypothetical protein